MFFNSYFPVHWALSYRWRTAQWKRHMCTAI